ncbi:hypothetical protein [Sinomonas mesophila]|uniref:hypothetical protein n=1 Tax=Sinomonas mesophila TaxID=1531955 RepID=UPI000985D706|nr:hypothetical protein [Sinomonas mesophila]
MPFLTRRVREQPAAAHPSSPASAHGRSPLDLSAPASTPAVATGQSRNPLDLSAPSAGRGATAAAQRTPTRPASPEERLYPAPALGELRQLTARDAVVRLNPRQAGVGSLVVTGARGVAWEGADRTTGAQSVHREEIGTPIQTAGNRPLLSFVSRDAVLVLRHARELRRALFIAAEGPMTAVAFAGAGVAVHGSLGAGQRTVLTATRIGSVLELRAESVPADWDDGQIWREFAFTMTVGLGAPLR